MKNLTCVWRNIYNTVRATHSRYYKHFAKHAYDFSLIFSNRVISYTNLNLTTTKEGLKVIKGLFISSHLAGLR